MLLGRYEVVRKLGEGGMARVLLARAPEGGEVVLKVPFNESVDYAERVRDEARVGLRLSHPNVVETLDLFEHEGRPILVVEYVHGATLQHLRKATGALPAPLVARVGRQVAEALAAIHEATDEAGRPLGILHRDVTPGNVLLTRGGDAKLIDLGIAKGVESRARPTAVGTVRGTMRYLAPELLQGAAHSPATDLWALGIVLLEATLGRRATEGGEREVLAAITRGTITELRGSERLEPALHDGIFALLAPAEARLQKARAAANVLARIEQALGDGTPFAREPVDRVLALIEEQAARDAAFDLADAPTRVRTSRPEPAAEPQVPRAVTMDSFANPFAEPTAATAPMAPSPPAPDAPVVETEAPRPDALPDGGDPRRVTLDAELSDAADTVQMTAAELTERGLEPVSPSTRRRPTTTADMPAAEGALQRAASPATTEQMPALDLARVHGAPVLEAPGAPAASPSVVDTQRFPSPGPAHDPANQGAAELASLRAATPLPSVAPATPQPAPATPEPPPPAVATTAPPAAASEAAFDETERVERGRLPAGEDALDDDELAWKPKRGPWLLVAAIGAVAVVGLALLASGLLHSDEAPAAQAPPADASAAPVEAVPAPVEAAPAGAAATVDKPVETQPTQRPTKKKGKKRRRKARKAR